MLISLGLIPPKAPIFRLVRQRYIACLAYGIVAILSRIFSVSFFHCHSLPLSLISRRIAMLRTCHVSAQPSRPRKLYWAVRRPQRNGVRVKHIALGFTCVVVIRVAIWYALHILIRFVLALFVCVHVNLFFGLMFFCCFVVVLLLFFCCFSVVLSLFFLLFFVVFVVVFFLLFFAVFCLLFFCCFSVFFLEVLAFLFARIFLSVFNFKRVLQQSTYLVFFLTPFCCFICCFSVVFLLFFCCFFVVFLFFSGGSGVPVCAYLFVRF